MALGIGPGPLFVYESLILSRRRQVYAGRALFVFLMLIGLATAWYSTAGRWARPFSTGGSSGTLQILARAGEKFFYATAAIQLAMVLLVAPVATAGAICEDRARGILAQLAATDLSSAEIVLGKLGSRLAPILGVLACGLPVTALAALLGGVDTQALVSLFAVSVAVTALGCALALALSARATKTHEVIIAVLALWTLWLLSLPIWSGASTISGVVPPPDWFKKANPVLLVYAPYARPGYVTRTDVAIFVTMVLLLAIALIARTIATVRRNVLDSVPSVERGVVRDKLKLSRWLERLPGPALDGNPVLWRQWHRNRPSRLARIIWVIYGTSSVLGVVVGIHEAIVAGIDHPSGSFTLIVALHLQSLFGLLIMSSVAPTALAEERLRGTLDVLMATPLSTRSIVWGKWLGTYRLVLWLTILPGLASVIVACLAPAVSARFVPVGLTADLLPLGLVDRVAAPCLVVAEMLTYGAAICSTGLALATWVPRLGRAIAINVVLFVLITIGWPLLFQSFLWPPLHYWLSTRWNLRYPDTSWLSSGMIVISPFVAPMVTLEWLLNHPSSVRWKFWLFALAWCALAWAFAAALYWAALKSFDRCLGRMPEKQGRAGWRCADRPYLLLSRSHAETSKASAAECSRGSRSRRTKRCG
jgi:ABC-type transport system involved in multi-copper enzyme maturation permease subunit